MGEEILDVIHQHGWKTMGHRSYLRDIGFVMDRVRRSTVGATPPPPPPPIAATDPTGIHRFAR
jgi:hypothetical protein